MPPRRIRPAVPQPAVPAGGPGRRRLLGLFAGGAAAALALAAGLRPARAAGAGGQRFICTVAHCQPYIYDPARGNPAGGVAPGTPFADLPHDWVCPVCAAGRTHFIPLG
jgi:rubredoxin